MGREAKPLNHEELTPQGYVRVKTAIGEWRLKHHIIAEQKLGRPLDTSMERVVFQDGDRTNFNSENLLIVPKRNGRKQRAEKIREQIKILQQELSELEASDH